MLPHQPLLTHTYSESSITWTKQSYYRRNIIIISQDLTRDRGDNKYAKAGQRHNEDGRRNKHNDYEDGRDNL